MDRAIQSGQCHHSIRRKYDRNSGVMCTTVYDVVLLVLGSRFRSKIFHRVIASNICISYTVIVPNNNTKKNVFLLASVLSYFIFDLKYFYICIIFRVSSFKWCTNSFSLICNGREIIGLRLSPAFVVISDTFPNYNSQLNFVPNNNT